MGIVRRNIINVKPYVAGKPIDETKRQLGLREVIKLASNENPLGASPRAVEAIRRAASEVNRYPDSSGYYLKRKLSTRLGVEQGSVVLGNGSDELIDIIIKTFVEEDEQILTADVTFLEYGIIASVNNRKLVTAPLKYFKYDLEKMKSMVGAKTKLVFIANPNNPTGTYVTRRELEEFLTGLPASVIVVIDEAYDTFIDVDDFPLGLRYIPSHNVIVLKTFSKGYGLAGVRLGFAVGSADLLSYMERVRQPFNVNSLAQAGALAALDDSAFLKKTRNTILQGKAYLYDKLQGLGIAYVASVANFILVDVRRDGVAVFKEMLKYGVIVRDMKQYGLKQFIRVTIGTPRENERFISVLKKVL